MRYCNNIKYILCLFIACLLAGGSFLSAWPLQADAALPDGSLFRQDGDFKVYYLDNGIKRWVDSVETFRIHGFSWEDVQAVDTAVAGQYREGAILTIQDNIILPGENEALPDLVPFPINELRFAERNGRTILKFSSTLWNQGRGPLELIGDPETVSIAGDFDRNVFQRIVRADGAERHKLVGNFAWHEAHLHYHFSDFAEYTFAQEGQDAVGPAIQEKATRCIWDTVAIGPHLAGAPRQKVYDTCKGKERQGVSVGWGDVYKYTLADQYLDVHDMPTGLYRLTFHIDPRYRFAELDRANNVSVVFLYLDVAQGAVEPVAAAASFPTAETFFPNRFLIQAEGDGKVYILHNNKKRWLRSEEKVQSYGYLPGDAHVLPKSIIDTIPFNNLIRLEGTSKVFALNDEGYKRHIASVEVFNSYGLRWEDIADISAAEFARYPDARVVRLAGDTDLYAIGGETFRKIDPIETTMFGKYKWDEIHVINLVDFESYGSQ